MNLIFFEQLYESHFFAYSLFAAFVLGIFAEAMAYTAVRKSLKDSEAITVSKSAWLIRLKVQYENSFRVSSGIENTAVFTEKHISDIRLFNVHINTWRVTNRLSFALCMLFGISEGILALILSERIEYVMMILSIIIWIELILLIAVILADIDYRQERIKNNLRDYLENNLKARVITAVESNSGSIFSQIAATREREEKDKREKRRRAAELRRMSQKEKKLRRFRKKMDRLQKKLSEPMQSGSTDTEGEARRRALKEALIAEGRKGEKRNMAEEDKVITDVLNEFLT